MASIASRRPLQRFTALPAVARSALAGAVLAVLMGCATAFYLWQAAGLTFYYDEWDFVINRRGWDLDTLLEPHNEHLSVVPMLVYKLLFAVVGLDPYWPYLFTVLVCHLVVVALVFVVARSRVGDVPALLAAAVVLFLGSAWESLLWPFQIGYLLSVAAGLGIIVLLERRTLLADAGACVLLALALASSSIGISIVVLAVALLAFSPDRWRRAWVALVPAALYAVWWLAYGGARPEIGGGYEQNLPLLPKYTADSAAGAVGGVTGLGLDWGRPLALVLGALVAIRLARSTAVPVRLVALLASALAFWMLGALTRGQLQVPESSRYLYFGGIAVVLIGVELLSRRPLRTRGLMVLTVAVGFAALGNAQLLRGGALHLRDYTGHVAAGLGALELAGPAAPTEFAPVPVHAPNVTAGLYFEAVEELGSPADSPAEIARREDPYRQTADSVLVTALLLSADAAASSPSGKRPAVEAAEGGAASSSGSSCVELAPTTPPAALNVAIPTGGLLVHGEGRAPVEVRLRRFADAFPEGATFIVPGSSPTVLRFPETPVGAGWHARLSSTAPLEVCGLVPA